MKRIAFIFCLAFLLASCTPQGPSEESIKIGILAHQTGFGAVWGDAEAKAALMRTEEINEASDVKLKAVVEDCASDVNKCVSAAHKLVNVDKVTAIIGPTWNEWYEPVAPIAEENQVILISPSGGSDKDLGPYTFSLRHSQEALAETILGFLLENKMEEVTIVTTQTAYYTSISRKFKNIADDLVVKEETVDPEEKDFKTIVAKLNAGNINVVFSNLFETQEATFIKQLKESGYDGLIMSSTASALVYDEELLPILEGIYYADYAISPEFAEKYRARYNSDPSPSAQHAYDAVSLLYNAMTQHGTDAVGISSYLTNLESFEGLSGTITFDEVGNAEWGANIYEIKRVG